MARTLEQILQTEKPEVVENAKAKAKAILLDIRLGQMRELLHQTQDEMAQALGVTQPTIAGMEKQGNDLKLSSLKRDVEAAGCKVQLCIELPDGRQQGFAL